MSVFKRCEKCCKTYTVEEDSDPLNGYCRYCIMINSIHISTATTIRNLLMLIFELSGVVIMLLYIKPIEIAIVMATMLFGCAVIRMIDYIRLVREIRSLRSNMKERVRSMDNIGAK